MIRLSDSAAALMADKAGLRKALANAQIIFFTGTQPASANDAAGTSQPIIAFTKDDGVLTVEVAPQWKFTMSNVTAADTVNSVKLGGAAGTNAFDILGGAVTMSDTNDSTGAAQVAAAINAFAGNAGFSAVAVGAAVTITGPRGMGAAGNSALLVVGTTGVTVAYNDGGGTGAVFTTGVSAVNGLTFDVPADGAGLSPVENVFYIQKPAGVNWQGKNGFGPGTAAADTPFTGIVTEQNYSAGWGRIICSPGDTGMAATSGADGYIRLDFSIGTVNEDFNMVPTTALFANLAAGFEVTSALNSFRLKISKQPDL